MSGIKIFSPEYYARMRELEAASWWNAAMRDVAGHMIDAVGLPVSGLLLDVGCGSGQTMDWFRRRWAGWRTIGLDVSMDGLLAARHADEDVMQASALDIPLSDDAVDAIITLDVLQHLPLDGGDMRALREMHRVLRPGGVLMIRTNSQTWPRAVDDHEYDFHKYESPELKKKLADTGFRVRRLGRLNALLGLAEIPRDLRAQKEGGEGYHGLLADVPKRNVAWHMKRAWLRTEGAMVAAGLSLPLGRSIVAVATAE